MKHTWQRYETVLANYDMFHNLPGPSHIIKPYGGYHIALLAVARSFMI